MTRALGTVVSPFETFEYLLRLQRNLGMSQSEMVEEQNRKLRHLIRHAYHTVPFYHRLFEKCNVDPDRIQTVRDLNLLPVVNKNALRSVPLRDRISSVFMTKPLKKMLTGGSTGQPFEVYVTREEQNLRQAHWLRILLFHGYSFFDKQATVAGMSGRTKERFFNRMNLVRRVEVPFDSSLPEQIKTMMNESSDIYEGYPSRFFMIAKYIEDNHVRIRKPKAIFVDSETLFPIIRSTIEKAFGVKVTNVYDSYEFGYTAWECHRHRGLHINCDSQVVQILQGDREVEDGENGEIVITGLDNYAMPFIRYDTLDVGAKSNRKCNCGLVFPMLENVFGRKWDFLLSPAGEEIPPLLVEQYIRKHKGVVEYQITQRSREKLDVKVVVSKEYDYDADLLIEKQLRDLYHFEEITVSHPGSIGRGLSGKSRCVIRTC